VTKFVAQLHLQGWIISKTQCSFPDYDNSVVGIYLVLIGIHNSTQSKVDPLMFKMPPTRHPLPLSLFIWQPFNKLEYQLSFACNEPSFETNDTRGNVATLPLPTLMALIPAGLTVSYYLHRRENNSTSLNGSAVVSLDSLCPQFDGSPNTNLFRYHLAWNSIATITHMSGQSCYSSLCCALASPTTFGIIVCRSLIIGLHSMPAFLP
jgi:hypothetical protein